MPRRTKNNNSESAIQKKCFQLLVANGYLVMRVNSASFGSHRQYKCVSWQVKEEPLTSTGTSDLICCSPTGQFIAIEMKKPGEKPMKHQKRYIAEVVSRGGVAFPISSVQELKDKLGITD